MHQQPLEKRLCVSPAFLPQKKTNHRTSRSGWKVVYQSSWKDIPWPWQFLKCLQWICLWAEHLCGTGSTHLEEVKWERQEVKKWSNLRHGTSLVQSPRILNRHQTNRIVNKHKTKLFCFVDWDQPKWKVQATYKYYLQVLPAKTN